MIIQGGTIVNEGHSFVGDIVIEGDRIVDVIGQRSEAAPSSRGNKRGASQPSTLDATGCYVLPGIIDDHVHFRG